MFTPQDSTRPRQQMFIPQHSTRSIYQIHITAVTVGWTIVFCRPPSSRWSCRPRIHTHPAIDQERRPIDVLAAVGSEKDHCAGDVFHGRPAPGDDPHPAAE